MPLVTPPNQAGDDAQDRAEECEHFRDTLATPEDVADEHREDQQPEADQR